MLRSKYQQHDAHRLSWVLICVNRYTSVGKRPVAGVFLRGLQCAHATCSFAGAEGVPAGGGVGVDGTAPSLGGIPSRNNSGRDLELVQMRHPHRQGSDGRGGGFGVAPNPHPLHHTAPPNTAGGAGPVLRQMAPPSLESRPHYGFPPTGGPRPNETAGRHGLPRDPAIVAASTGDPMDNRFPNVPFHRAPPPQLVDLPGLFSSMQVQHPQSPGRGDERMGARPPPHMHHHHHHPPQQHQQHPNVSDAQWGARQTASFQQQR
eukprot:m.1386563 g.1386563  ORF g.1386563 m.1386563 type:complete len:261 (+) comp24976_c0_seq2:2681-3463(+)